MSSVNRFSVAVSCFLVGLVAVLVFLPSETSAASSHYETYITYETQSYYRCYPYTYTYCYNWYYWNYWYWGWSWGPYYYYYNWYYWNPYYGYYYWWPCCYYQTHYDCYWNYQSVAVTRTRCQSRWSGTYCDVPSCSPACGGGQICVDLDRCECANGGSSACSMVPCSTSSNCYPGTCVSGACKCANGFNGTNCERILQKPAISECKVKLYAQPPAYGREVAVAEADCAAEGLEAKTAWVGRDLLNTASTSLGFTKLEPVWRADYTSPIAMPSRPTGATTFFISNAPVVIGVSQTTFSVIFPTYTVAPIVCLAANDNVDPANSKLCDIATPWTNLGVTSLLTNNVSFTVNITASLGGTKKGDGTYTYNGFAYNFLPQQFTGTPITVRAKFQIDLVPPTHCLLQSDDHSNCTVFPIYLDQDIRTNPVIEPKFLNWTDKESGIDRYHVQVFYMESDALNTLSPIGDALISSDITPYLNNFKFTTPKPGVYSIVLTTFDRANNSAKARKIYNFNDQPSFTTTNAPVYIQEADNNTANSFVTTIYNRRQLTLKWPGRFKTDDIYNDVLLRRVNPWTIDPYTIDDNFDSKYGMRSINAINPKNLTGISAITYRYIVDPNGGLGVEEPTDNVTWPVVSDKTAESVLLNFTEPLKDGDTVVVWLKAVDVTGNPSVAVVKTFIDASKVEVANDTFVSSSVDPYTSTVIVTAFDRETGIKGINYVIYDALTKVNVHSDFQPATTRDPPNLRRKRAINQPCLPGDSTCYCTPMRTCFNYHQVVVIDHCWIDRYAGPEHRLQFLYTVVNIAGVPDSSASTPNVLEFGDIKALLCRATQPPPTPGPALSGGGIAGIVIGSIFGFLLLACLIIIIVLMVVRVVQHKPAIPDRKEMRTYAHNVRNRFTMRYNRSADNDMYVGAGPPPRYPGPSRNNKSDDLHMDKVETDAFKVQRKQVQMGDTIAEGRFAIVRKAVLEKGSSNEQVAAKALKRGFAKADELLMLKKISFLRDLPAHGNIIRFVGSVDEAVDEGPIMLLELCEISLKDWLTNMRSVSTDDLEVMLVFTLDIARGVEHLHANKIIHRRLAVRNVLLKQVASGLAAKLIGFGPSADDTEDSSTGAGASSVPIKWMAPETLDTLNSRKPTYNEKTDAWAYGITIWEIYSQGAAPYNDVKSADVRGMIKHGHRLACPHECPPELFSAVVQPCWSESPKQRPTFSAICRKVDEFRSGSERPQEGYYASDQAQYNSSGAGRGHPEEMYADGM